jgi:hypothetical protein
MYLSNALSVPVFYYSHLLNVCEFNAAKIFLLESKGWGWGPACMGLFYCEYAKI